VLEIRFHGISGEGVVTAADLLAGAAVLDGKWSQSLPYFTTERRGSPVVSFVRINDSPIWVKSFIQNPDLVVVTNPAVMKFVKVTEGMKESARLLVNTPKSASELELGGKTHIRTIDANKIASETIKKPIANVILLGALLGVEEVVSFNSLKEAVSQEFPEELAKKNLAGMQMAYNTIKGAN
jgi:pyruvate ferredoxin oxidoreductase gamma subunit